MVKNVIVLTYILLLGIGLKAQEQISCEKAISKIQEIGKSTAPTEYTFIQETIQFKENSTDTSTWYETVNHPGFFRIDFGDISKGNTDMYLGDSVYIYRSFELKTVRHNPHPFLYFEGEMFTKSAKDALKDFSRFKLDQNQCYVVNEGYLIGSSNTKTESNYILLSKDNAGILAVQAEIGNGQKYRALVTERQTIDGKNYPKIIEFYIGDRLIQSETYLSVETENKIPDNFFETEKQLNTEHWFTK